MSEIAKMRNSRKWSWTLHSTEEPIVFVLMDYIFSIHYIVFS